MSTIKINTCDKEWFGKDYVFYDKSGNPINILYDAELDQYKGTLYFSENSSDTFEELEINTFERIRGFEYQQYTGPTGPDEILTQKFQLFNTDGMNLIGNTQSSNVSRIESVNNRSDFYSKWIFGKKIDLLFPHGTEVKLNKSVFGLNHQETYTVINSKQNAILIISSMDNKSFVDTFGGVIDDESKYINLNVSGVNALKIYNYINSDFENQLPSWSEPNFYNFLFVDQKLSIVNSTENNGVFTVKNKSLGDNYYSNYKILVDDLDGDLSIRVTNKTSNFNVFKGQISFNATFSTIELSDIVPSLIKPDTRFQVPSSLLNNKSFKVDVIPYFDNIRLTYYTDGLDIGTGPSASKPDQVLYENNIFECITSYTQSATQSIDPYDVNYWTQSTFIPITQNIVYESLNGTNIFLEDNQIELNYLYDIELTPRINLANAFNIHAESLNIMGATPYLDPLGAYGIIKSKYPTEYLNIEYLVDKLDTFSGSTTGTSSNFAPTGYTFSYDPYIETELTVKLDNNTVIISEDYLSSSAWVYFSDSGSASSLDFDSLNENTELYWKSVNANFGLTPSNVITVEYTTEVSVKENIIERIIELEEDISNEKRKEDSIRPERRIVVTDIDEFGLIITLNDQVYSIDSTLLYRDTGEIDLEESIDATLKDWVTRWRLELDNRGIFISSEYFGNNNQTVLHNALFIRGFYPNIPLDIVTEVGDTAEFYYPDKAVIIYQMGETGSQFNLTINNRSYIEPFVTDVTTTLTNWADTHTSLLSDIGIIVVQINQVLYFRKIEDFDINIEINVGKSFLPGEKVTEVIEYWIGNEGLIISSNRIIQNNIEISFEEECFSTGQIISMNNSNWILNNQEYNITYLDPDRMLLSYQGPFWGTIDNSLQNAFFELAFGDDLLVGESILALVNGNLVNGTITSVSGNSYQILYNSTQTTTIPRTNAFGYDPGATYSLGASSSTDVITFVDTKLNTVDLDYFSTNYRVSSINDDTIFTNDEVRITQTIDLSENAIKQVVNPINNFLFILTDTYVYVIDPITEEIKTTITNLGTGWDIECDYLNGDVYVSYSDSDRISIISVELTTTSVDYYPSHFHGKMTYNRDERSLYVFTRINTDVGVTSSKALYRVDLDDNTIRDNSFLIATASADYLGMGTTGSEGYLGGGTYSNGTIHYNEFNGDLYISNLGSLNRINTSTQILEDLGIDTNTYYSTTLDTFNKYFWISNFENRLIALEETENRIVQDVASISYGYILANPDDSHIYIGTADGTDELLVFSTYINNVFYTFEPSFEMAKIIYNKRRVSIMGIDPGSTQMVDIKIDFIYNGYKSVSNAFNQSNLIPVIGDDIENLSSEDGYGTLASNYTSLDEYLLIKSREYIRKPRQNYSTTGSDQVKWVYGWETDDTSELFMVDISGDYLPISGSYAYTGEKPLDNPIIRRTPNINFDLVDKSYSQQTVFDTLTYSLDFNDSETNISFIPEGIQTILGFNSRIEGVVSNSLLITQYEDISLSYPSYASFSSATFSTLPIQNISLTHNDDTGYGEISFNIESTDTFDEIIDLSDFTTSQTNLDVGHIININVRDNTNEDPYISENNNIEVKIVEKYLKTLIVSYLDSNREFITESTEVLNYPIGATATYLDFSIEVQPKIIADIDIKGQTEIEDIRYTTELTNTGKLINPEDIYIFKEYDISEGGIDWNFMNGKRKEMLTVRNDIYNYIGAYRSIINAINFFGYNDLELYEYFQNINVDSPNYLKLDKVEIPDIFDNSVEGWTDNYKYWRYPNENFEETKLFNLTYRITDFDGNKLSTYSLEEILIKISGLKRWLEKNIVPLTHEILDITGRIDFRQDGQIYHTPAEVKIYKMNDTITPVNFDLNETYVLPVQSGSTVYNNVIDFSVGETASIPDYFDLSIRTYKIYDGWDPFISYIYEEKVKYFGIIYKNVLLDITAESLGQDPTLIKNTNNNPKFYENTEKWSSMLTYEEDDLVNYKRRIYKFSLQTSEANYLPWIGATGNCMVGTPSTTNGLDDNFYTELIDRVSDEPIVPDWWVVSEDNVDIYFDIMDLFRTNYPNSWCDLVTKNVSTVNNLAIDMMNLPDSTYTGTKPSSILESESLITMMVDDFLLTKEQYKYKFRSLNPQENLLQDNTDFILWDDITEWLEIDLEPVQYLSEFRSGTYSQMLLPYNFTLDTNIDPYVVIECRSDNGYGQIKNIRKSYEIRFDADSDDILIKTIR